MFGVVCIHMLLLENFDLLVLRFSYFRSTSAPCPALPWACLRASRTSSEIRTPILQCLDRSNSTIDCYCLLL